MREEAAELAKLEVSVVVLCVPARAAAPAPVLETLNGEIKALLDRDDMKTTIGKMGATGRLGHAAAIFRLRAGGNHQVRRHHQAAKACRWTRIEGALVFPVRMIC